MPDFKLFKRRLEKVDVFEKTIDEYDSTYEKVVYLLKKYPNVRNNDTLLLIAYWKEVNRINFKKIDENDSEEILRMTSAETIRRVRCKIQNDYGLFLPTEETEQTRKIRQKAIKKWVVD